ncbi:MAG: right-handed parallel beta-helix repeat-containing protein [Prevotella sp.]|nr:right-handed parallel beta-helix repeat-containing protein [Prevotella sp.]
MKKILLSMMLMCVAVSTFAELRSWKLVTIPAADETNMKADDNWKTDSKSRYCYTQALNNEVAKANGVELTIVEGLKFTFAANSDGNLRFGGETASMWLGTSTFVIPNCEAGNLVKIEYMTSKSSASRKFTATNLETELPASSGKTHVTATAKVVANGDVTIGVTDGMYIYGIEVGTEDEIDAGSTGGTGEGNPDNPTDTARGLIYTDAESIATPPAGTEQVLWCSPDGKDTGDGSEANPFYNLQYAVDKALPGTTIYMKAGTYQYDARININDRNGTHDKYITVMCPDGRAVLDFSKMPYHAHSNNPQQGIRLTSSYWHFYKIDICNASDNGLLIERNKPTGGSAKDIIARTQDGHDNIIEFCHFYKNGDTGLQMKNMAEFNYVLNCDSYLNCDEDNGDADGFAPKISVGDGNYFYGCRAYLNSDDGYDVFFKKEGDFTDNKTIVFENCIASRNGKMADGSSSQGNANGFKMGSDQGRMNVVLNRCIAACNGSKGFDQNHNTGDIIMNNCTGMTRTNEVSGKSVKYSYSYKIYEALASGSVCQLNNCVAINDNYENGKDMNGVDAKKGKSDWGGIRVDETYASLTTSNLKADPAYFNDLLKYTEIEAERQADGSLPVGTFAHINETTGKSLIDAGTDIPENTRYASTGVKVPAIAYTGSKPDLGAYEVGMAEKVVKFGNQDPAASIGFIKSTESNGRQVRLVQAFNGMVILSLEGGKAAELYTVKAYNQAGQFLGEHQFNGTNTSLYLPGNNGMLILKVEGNGVNETVKVAMK